MKTGTPPLGRRLSTLVFAFAALGLAIPATAGEVRFRSGAAEIAEVGPDLLATDLALLSARPESRHIVVRMKHPLTAPERRAVEAGGLRLLRPLGENAFFAAVPPGIDAEGLAGLGLVAGVTPIQPPWKLHPHFIDRGIPTWAVVEEQKADATDDAEPRRRPLDVNPTIAVYVLFHPDVELVPDAVALVAQHGGRVRSDLQSINALVVEMPYLMVDQLAADDAVQYIEPALPKFRELNNSNSSRTGADVAQQAPYNLDGTGVNVLVYDGGDALASHVDFEGRLTVRDTAGLSDHSTHVCGTVGGAGVGNPLYVGMAPGVTIESYGFEQEGGLQQGFLYSDPGDLEADYTEAINVYGCVIANNSIGTNTAPNGFPCEWEGDYGITSQLIDSIVGGSLGADIRIIWANGNERQTSVCYSTDSWPGEYHSTAPPACAKNHITVGALNSNDDTMTSFSSWGPADDGRLKPDISAPGCQSDDDFDVTSCSSSGGYTGKCGTSMAAPTVTGLSALLLQDFRLNNPSEPDFRNSTLKAVLAQTAVDLGNVGPDYQFGYGSVRVVDAIDLMREARFVENEVDQDDVFSALVTVTAGDSELRVTAAWDDAPGTPNVDPALVNDLDLQVLAPDGTKYFPWTLTVLDPGLPAVRTVADHLNNIEQVVIDAPAPGIYRIDVIGFNVPQGPQTFSIAASPTLINCSSKGVVAVDKTEYACDSQATVRVVDCDLNTDDGIVEQVIVTVASDTEPVGESLTLTETGPETSAFEGSILLGQLAGPGIVQVVNGDMVTASYLDADDGAGNTNVIVTDDAPIDCLPPGVLTISTTNLQPRSATVDILADEPVRVTVTYGTNCGALTDTASSLAFLSNHLIGLSNLQDDTTYFYTVDLTDEAGNSVLDDNGGACYSFTTPAVPDFFTEQYTGGIDLDGVSVKMTPNGSLDAYAACAEPITALPTDPSTGTSIGLSDDGSQLIAIGLGQTVQVYGTTYSQLYVNANGNITFTNSDGDYTESITDHFDTPRVSVLFDDFNPSAGGTVSWEQFADRMVVTWENVPEYSTSNSNTFQAELFFDGTIRVSYLGLAGTDGVSGLSEGLGIPPDFFESDLGNQLPCNLPGDVTGDGVVDINDLLDVLAAWGPCGGCPEDTNNDGFVDVTDLLQVLGDWTVASPLAATDGSGVPAPGETGAGVDLAADVKIEDDPRGGGPVIRTFINDGVVAPADHGGLFELDRSYRQLASGTLSMAIAGDTPVEERDLVVIAGRAELSGLLTVEIADDATPTAGDRFVLLAAREVVGEFREVRVTASVDSPAFEIVYDASTVSIVFRDGSGDRSILTSTDKRPRAAGGDVDGNGVTNVRDVRILLERWNGAGGAADLNRDGVVDGADLAEVLRGLE